MDRNERPAVGAVCGGKGHQDPTYYKKFIHNAVVKCCKITRQILPVFRPCGNTIHQHQHYKYKQDAASRYKRVTTKKTPCNRGYKALS